MEPSRFFRMVMFLVFMTWVGICQAQNMYCGKLDCYLTLGVDEDATAKEIKLSYRKLSLKYHPDKSTDPDAKEKFQSIAKAYETLIDPKKRVSYDYYMAHPEEFAYNSAMYYHHVYAPKSDFRIITIGLILVISVIQWVIRNQQHSQALEYFKKSDEVKRKAQEIYQSNKGHKRGRIKKRSKEQEREEIQKIIQQLMDSVHIVGGCKKPKPTDLLLVQMLILPFTLFKYAVWNVQWLYRYRIKKAEYSREDMIYLTCKMMEMTEDRFNSSDFDNDRDSILERRLWENDNFERYKEDLENEFRRKYPERHKRMIRTKRSAKPDFGVPDDNDY